MDQKTLDNLKVALFTLLKIIILLYLFVLSLELMGDALKLFGKDFSKNLIATTTNPLVGLFIGILATSIIQSSSTTTSIVVGLVASGAFTVGDSSTSIQLAIPLIMGANIGTSITNTIASLPQINHSNEFKRAFAAATVHDFFNFLSVIILFPLQYFTNFLGKAAYMLETLFENVGGLKFLSPVKALTKPAAKWIIELIGEHPWIVLILAVLLLFMSLKFIVDVLKGVVVEKAKYWFDRYLFKTDLRALTVGILLTVLVQSSSITTSLIVPLAGAGLLTLFQIFPYTMGANIGTTVTAILAALVTGNSAAIAVAFSHLLFNISGMIIWWPLRRVPIYLAAHFAEITAKRKYLSLAYLLVLFFIIPIIIIYFAR